MAHASLQSPFDIHVGSFWLGTASGCSYSATLQIHPLRGYLTLDKRGIGGAFPSVRVMGGVSKSGNMSLAPKSNLLHRLYNEVHGSTWNIRKCKYIQIHICIRHLHLDTLLRLMLFRMILHDLTLQVQAICCSQTKTGPCRPSSCRGRVGDGP